MSVSNGDAEKTKPNTMLPEDPQTKTNSRLAQLSLAALGVVFGDISTSPIYAIRECFHGEYGIVGQPCQCDGHSVLDALGAVDDRRSEILDIRFPGGQPGGRRRHGLDCFASRAWPMPAADGCWASSHWASLRHVCCMGTE